MAGADNPFSRMIEVLQQQARKTSGPAWGWGEVSGTAPLRVLYQGVQLAADQLADADKWAAALTIGDKVAVLPNREDGQFAIIRPGGTDYAPADHDHDEIYSAAFAAAEHAHGNLTNDGKIGVDINRILVTTTDGAVTVKSIADFLTMIQLSLIDLIYPVGTLYESEESTSPATLFGGTWQTYGAGRVVVGLDSSDTDFDTVGETGGAKTHTHAAGGLVAAIAHIANSTASYYKPKAKNWTSSYVGTFSGNTTTSTTSRPNGTEVIGDTDAGSSLQPYIVAYRWKRTA